MKHLVFSVTLLALLLSLVYADKEKKCPPGFIKHEDYCYWFSSDTGTFAENIATCYFLGSHLADITTEEEDKFIQHELLSNYKDQNFFIGATEWRSEGVWAWEHPVRIFKNSWTPNELDQAGNVERCLMLVPMDGIFSHWFSQKCSVKIRCICETKAYVPK